MKKQKALAQMMKAFNCNKIYKSTSMTTKAAMALDEICTILETAFIATSNDIEKSYKAFIAIKNIKRFANNHSPITNIDDILGVIKNYKHIDVLKCNLTAFELYHLCKQIYNNDTDADMAYNRQDNALLIKIGKTAYKSTLTELFAYVGCQRPFYVNPNANNCVNDVLTFNGKNAYNKLMNLLDLAMIFGYPDIKQDLDNKILKLRKYI